MTIRKYASVDLKINKLELVVPQQSLSKFGSFAFKPRPGYVYPRVRAISARINKNFDGFPSIELQKAAHTFQGRPVFVNHNNSDPERTRGVILASQYHGLQDDPHITILPEIDALTFPGLAKDIVNGNMDSVSMGCFPPGAPVTLADGTTKPIQNIELGDKVITHTGLVEPVTYVMVRDYDGLLYRLSVYGNNDLVSLTGEHPVWVRRPRGLSGTDCVCGETFRAGELTSRGTIRKRGGLSHHITHKGTGVHSPAELPVFEGWIKAEDVQEGDYVLTPALQMQGDPGEYHFARLLGYYLAEGNLCNGGSAVEWTLHEDEVDFAEELRISSEALGHDLVGPFTKDGSKAAVYRVNDREFAAKFIEFGGKHSWGKELNPDVLAWSPDNQKVMLQAYLNGDGSKKYPGVQAHSSSVKLHEQLLLVATRAGYVTTRIGRVHDRYSGAPLSDYQSSKGCIDTLSSFLSFYETRDARQERDAYVDIQGLWRRIKKVDTREYLGKVYNFDVQGDDSYVAHRIAVHNCDVDNSTCSYCGNVATTAEEFCDHILNNKGQELTKLESGQPKRILVFEICRGLNFFEISFVFDPADETAVMQEVIVPNGVKMASASDNFRPVYFSSTAVNRLSKMAKSIHLGYGEMIAPPKVDTLRDDDLCPQCGSDFNGIECDNCGYITPPEELQDPDTKKAGDIRENDDESNGDKGDLDYFGDDDDDSDNEDEESDEDEDEPNPYDLYSGQPRKEGNVVSRTAVQANVGQALAQRRLAEAQRRLQALGEYPLYEEGVDTGENIASQPPAPEAPAEGSDETVAAPDFSTTVENLDQEAPAGDYGDRERVMASTRRKAEDMSNSSQAQPDDRENVEAPVANMTDDRAQQSQYDESGWDNNAENQSQGGGDSSGTSTVVPDGTGRSPMQTGAATNQPTILKKASASQVYQLADLYTELGLVPHEQRYAAIASIEKMPAIVAQHTIKVLGRVKEVFATQMPQGRVARTAGTIPVLGKTATSRTPSMARQAENRRLASNAEDTLLFVH